MNKEKEQRAIEYLRMFEPEEQPYYLCYSGGKDSLYDPDTGERQLISVCKRCHEQLHPESQKQYRPANKPVTEERWD